MRKRLELLLSDKYFIAAFILFIIGALLRLYKLPEFITFLGDQGRDAIIIKRILTLEHLPAIGAPTSVGQVYLGPFYYYFISPWLVLFNFDPVGLAYGVAAFSSLFILINYFAIKDLFNKTIALVSTIFITFSSVLLIHSRYSWNPNLLPLFSILFMYFFIKSLREGKIIFYLLAGAFFSFCLQLHYLSLYFAPPIVVCLVIFLLKKEKKAERIIRGGLVMFSSFFLFSSPLLIFDSRHNFLNSKNFIKLLKSEQAASTGMIRNFFSTFYQLNRFAFNFEINQYLSITLVLAIIVLSILLFRKKNNIFIVLVFFILALSGISLYEGQIHPHYFNFIYPVYYLLIAYFLSLLTNSRIRFVLTALFAVSFVILNSQGYFFFYQKGLYQIEGAKKVASKIKKTKTKNKYSVTALPVTASDSMYRYFLEIWDEKPIAKDSRVRAEELFVVCEEECQPIGHPQWDIAYFAPKRVEQTYQVENVKIYKLVR